MKSMAAPPIRISYSADDLIAGAAQHWINALRGFRTVRTMLIVGPLFGLLYAWWTFESGASVAIAVLAFASIVVTTILVVLVLSVVNRVLILPRAARRAFSQLKEYAGEWTIEVGETEIHITTSRGNVVLPFTDFVKWCDGEKVFLIYRSDRSYNVIPQRAMTANQKDSLLKGLRAAGVPCASFRNS